MILVDSVLNRMVLSLFLVFFFGLIWVKRKRYKKKIRRHNVHLSVLSCILFADVFVVCVVVDVFPVPSTVYLDIEVVLEVSTLPPLFRLSLWYYFRLFFC